MKFACAGVLVVFGPTGMKSNEGIVEGVAVVHDRAYLAQSVANSADIHRLIASSLHAPFQQYLEGSAWFDYVVIDIVYDLRLLALSWRALADKLGVAFPNQCQGFPSLGATGVQRSMLELCQATGVAKRTRAEFDA